jgi:NAD+ synthase (glutamine-hydrolysing)
VEDAAFLAANERALQAVAEAARGITAIVGFIDHDPAMVNDHGTVKKYNAAAVVRDGRVIQRARKSLLPSYRYFDDKRFFSPGERRESVDAGTGGALARIGVSICEDLWDDYYDVKPVPELVAKGAEVVFNLNASPFYPGKREIRQRLIKAHVDRLHRPIVYVNTVGAADNGKNIIPFDGESLVYDAGGRLVAMGRQFEEDLVIVDIGSQSRAEPLDVKPAEPEREMYDALVMALRDYMRKIGFTRAVIAVSGGIDSALALAIAVDALGPDRVAAFNLPSRYNTEMTRSIAQRLSAAFGVRYTVIPIQPIDEEIRGDFERHAHPIAQDLTRENLHARIRGVLMMAESNDSGALLISCGNETEIALGYATLFGDMCGGF